MTSKPTSECYVYIHLPGATSAVVAGKFRLTTDRRGSAVGNFVYARSYLDRKEAVPFDPVELLTLSDRPYTTAKMKGVFGALRDAGPDYWGRRVIDRHVRGRNSAGDLGEIDYLLNSADDRAGALGFGLGVEPPAPTRKFNRTLDLTKVQEIADALIKEEEGVDGPDAEQVAELLLFGTSMGGARPKVVVEDDDALWLAKLTRPDDDWNFPRVEQAMLALGRACGLVCAESRLVAIGGRDALLVKRFDRSKVDGGYTRARMVSALTLLRAEDTHTDREKWSYVALAEELRRIGSEPKKDANELFKRMVFNALISNLDDHPRNHAVIAKDRAWKLSPAYDLMPSKAISLEHRDLAMTCGDAGRYANAENLISQCARFLLTKPGAAAIVDDMEAKVRAEWYKVARAEGVSERDCEKIRHAFAYEGFRYSLKATREDVKPAERIAGTKYPP